MNNIQNFSSPLVAVGSDPSATPSLSGSIVLGATSEKSIPPVIGTATEFTRCMQAYKQIRSDINQRQQEVQEIMNGILVIQKNLDAIAPEARPMVAEMLHKLKMQVQARQQEIIASDNSKNLIRQKISQKLKLLAEKDCSGFLRTVDQYQWPDLAACQDLSLPAELITLICSRKKDGDPRDLAIMELCEIIKKLKNKAYMEEVTHLEHEEIKERRRKIQPPSFKGGSASKAKDWLKEYNAKTDYLRFTEKEKIEDVGTRLEGDALKWYTCFSLKTEKSWNKFEEAFMEFLAGNENSIGIAWHQLAQLKQGNMRINQFALKFRELAERAGIESDGLLIAYLKAAIDPELRRVLIYRSPTTFTEAVSICIEVEPDLARLSQAQTLLPTTIGRGSQRYHRQKPNNFQCFRCKQSGHLKRDCKAKLVFPQ